ncbi:hypothetical protein ACWEO1_40610, partial [Kitasatospora cineracea]
MTTRPPSTPDRRSATARLARARTLATGEPHQLALSEATAHGTAIPGPAHPEQELWEARVLAALLAAPSRPAVRPGRGRPGPRPG